MYELGPELTHCGTPGNNSTFMRKRAPSITFTAQFLAQYSTLHVLFVRCLVPSSIPRRVKFFLLILFKFKETLTTCTTWYNRTVSIPLIPYKGRHKKKKTSSNCSIPHQMHQIAPLGLELGLVFNHSPGSIQARWETLSVKQDSCLWWRVRVTDTAPNAPKPASEG